MPTQRPPRTPLPPTKRIETVATPLRAPDASSPDSGTVLVAATPTRSPTQVWVAAFAVASILAGAYWVWNRLSHVHVSDARISATMVAVSTRVPGWIDSLPVEEGQHIVKGDVIAVIDRREALLSLSRSEAQVGALRAALERVRAERGLAAATLESRVERMLSEQLAAAARARGAEADLVRAKAEWDRATPLFEREIISREIWEQKRSEHSQAEQQALLAGAEVRAAAAAVAEARAQQKELDVFDVRLQGMRLDVQEAEARRDQLKFHLEDHQLVSPIDGVVDEVFVDAGEYLVAGQQLMVIHDPEQVWVSANVKETDIRHLSPGKTARVRVDAYPGETFDGVIRRVGNAATSQFALLPNPNPSGNFTKITQRLEVRIDLEQEEGMLKPGMMVEVEIDI